MDLGARIASWRRAKGLSQKQLAEAVGVTPQAVCMWESGASWRNVPSTRSLTKIVEVFGVSMERFYGRIPKAKKAAA